MGFGVGYWYLMSIFRNGLLVNFQKLKFWFVLRYQLDFFCQIPKNFRAGLGSFRNFVGVGKFYAKIRF